MAAAQLLAGLSFFLFTGMGAAKNQQVRFVVRELLWQAIVNIFTI